jgi:hypothetical protein
VDVFLIVAVWVRAVLAVFLALEFHRVGGIERKVAPRCDVGRDIFFVGGQRSIVIHGAYLSTLRSDIQSNEEGVAPEGKPPLIRFAAKGRFKAAFATIVVVADLSACSGGPHSTAVPGQGPLPGSAQLRTLSSSDFKRVAAWGSKGQPAVAGCPPGYKVIGGGSSSSDGSSVSTGYPTSSYSGWVVKTATGASAEAFATCVSQSVFRESFRWRTGAPISSIAEAQCRSDFNAITGYGLGAVKSSWFDPGTNAFWVTGGGTAYASCVRGDAGIFIKHAWNQSQKPKTVFAGCGTGNVVIAGSMGDSQWPGPPIQQHPGNPGAPSEHGDRGWWTFSNAQNELTWAACVKAS